MASRSKLVGWRLWLPLIGIGAAAVLTYALAVGTTVEPGLQSPKTGTVLDAETGLPLAGVYVVARWHDSVTDPFMIGEGKKVEGGCLYRAIVRTDDRGRYSIPSTDSNFQVEGNFRLNRSRKYFWDLYTYHKGYGIPQQKIPSGIGPIYDGHPSVTSKDLLAGAQTLEPVLLAKDHAPPDQRMTTLSSFLSHFACASDDHEPIAREVYDEAYNAACTPQPIGAVLALPEFRRAASPPMAPTSSSTDLQVEEITKRYGRMSQKPLAPDDARTLCTLLGPADQEHQWSAFSSQ